MFRASAELQVYKLPLLVAQIHWESGWCALSEPVDPSARFYESNKRAL